MCILQASAQQNSADQDFGARFSMITNIATKPQTMINLLMSSSDKTIVMYTKATIAQ
jgi:hypothetical protein